MLNQLQELESADEFSDVAARVVKFHQEAQSQVGDDVAFLLPFLQPAEYLNRGRIGDVALAGRGIEDESFVVADEVREPIGGVHKR